MAIGQKAREAMEKVDSRCNGCELFRIAKQRVGGKKDVVGISCLKDEYGAVKVRVNANMGLCQEEGLSMLCLFCGDLVKNSEQIKRSCFLYLLT